MNSNTWITLENAPKFEINSSGEIRWRTTHILIIHKLSRGKLRVTLNLTNQPKRTSVSFQVHTVVAKYFVPNPNNYKYIVFIDKNVQNVKANNLAWSTNPDYISTE